MLCVCVHVCMCVLCDVCVCLWCCVCVRVCDVCVAWCVCGVCVMWRVCVCGVCVCVVCVVSVCVFGVGVVGGLKNQFHIERGYFTKLSSARRIPTAFLGCSAKWQHCPTMRLGDKSTVTDSNAGGGQNRFCQQSMKRPDRTVRVEMVPLTIQPTLPSSA